MNPALMLFARAGSPQQQECEDIGSKCIVCAGSYYRSAVYDKWQGSSFTDQNKLRGHGLSSRVCEPCVWAHSWVAPPDKPPNPVGTKGLNLRLFSHFMDGRGYVSLNKAQKPAIREWLRAPKHGLWWAAIADTGQKHVIPWARLNAERSPGIVRFEERDVAIGDWSEMEVVTAALTAGITKEELTSGLYGTRAWTIAETHVRAVEELGRRHRGGGWWSLLIWLSQRDEEAVASRLAAEQAAKKTKKESNGQSTAKGGRARRGGGSGDGDASGVLGERSQPAEPLGPAPRPAAGSDEVQREHRDASDGVASRAEAGSAQLGLFGIG